MSVDRFLELMVEDPELRQRLVDAGSDEERAAMVAELGIELPTKDEVEARIAELQAMSDVDGGALGPLRPLSAANFPWPEWQ
ncbi:MAG: Nif11-like leader peptide family natural product precursor [Acidimicrobiia bacterium]